MSKPNHRLRKYLRKKEAARCACREKSERLTALYWRYHFKAYGPHENLWP